MQLLEPIEKFKVAGRVGYFLSPTEADALFQSIESARDCDESRWKVIGFCVAHSKCCPNWHQRYGELVLWEIENDRTMDSASVCFLRMSLSCVDAVLKARFVEAWRSRIKRHNSDLQEILIAAKFFDSQEEEAIHYLELALELAPGDVSITEDLQFARKMRARKKTTGFEEEESPRALCMHDISIACESLLARTMERCYAEPGTWDIFEALIRRAVKTMEFQHSARYSSRLSKDAPAEDRCRLGIYESKYYWSEDDAALLDDMTIRRYWNDLVGLDVINTRMPWER
jgi:hypothetical protein